MKGLTLLSMLLTLLGSSCAVFGFHLQATTSPWKSTCPVFFAASSTQQQRKSHKHAKALETSIDASLEQGQTAVLLIDANNVRGKTDFQWTHRDLFRHLNQMQNDYDNLDIICIMDHGCKPEAIRMEGMVVAFSGPDQTADDVIAQATGWFRKEEANVFVVTSDGELKRRCLRHIHNRQKKWNRNKPRIKVFGSLPFVRTLEGMGQFHTDDSTSVCLDRIQELEEDLRRFRHSNPPWTSPQAQIDAGKRGPWKTAVLECRNDDPAPALWPLPQSTFEEKTWHRVLIAENLRCNLREETKATPVGSLLEKYMAYYNTVPVDVQSIKRTTLDSKFSNSSMFLDHRIKYEPYLQNELLHYLEQAVSSTTNSPFVSKITATAYLSPVQLCAAFLRDVVQESPNKGQQDLLLRYKNEAPSHLQFTRQSDLVQLLQMVASRDRKDAWQLREDYQSALEQWSVQPRRGRRAQRRPSRSQARNRQVDQALIKMGRDAERSWFELLK